MVQLTNRQGIQGTDDSLGRSKSRFGGSLGVLVRESTDDGRELVQILLCIARDDLYTTVNGEIERVRCRTTERITAVDRLMERGYGKVVQALEISIPELSPAQEAIASMSVIELEEALGMDDDSSVIDIQPTSVT